MFMKYLYSISNTIFYRHLLQVPIITNFSIIVTYLFLVSAKFENKLASLYSHSYSILLFPFLFFKNI